MCVLEHGVRETVVQQKLLFPFLMCHWLLSRSVKSASSIRPPDCTLVCSFTGHRDGVWQVAHARNGQPLLGSASVDGTSCVWDVNSGALILRYTGHNGSGRCLCLWIMSIACRLIHLLSVALPIVNDIAFHPTECNICTGTLALVM